LHRIVSKKLARGLEIIFINLVIFIFRRVIVKEVVAALLLLRIFLRAFFVDPEREKNLMSVYLAKHTTSYGNLWSEIKT
jgi:hypothetical protein